MLKLKPTYEEMLREAKTRRLKILPERERRTQQGILLDEVDFNDFDLDNYDKKTILLNENPEKGTQTDIFHKTSTTESESAKSINIKEEEQQQADSEYSQQTSEASEEKEKQKSLMQRLFDSLFDEVEADLPRSRQTSYDSGARGSDEPMPNKKSETPIHSSSSSRKPREDFSEASSSSSTSRSVLLPVESAPVSVNSSRSPTIEYVDEEDLPVNVSSSSSNRTVQYVSSRSSRSSRPITISSGSR